MYGVTVAVYHILKTVNLTFYALFHHVCKQFVF